jgi:hypothetical protein
MTTQRGDPFRRRVRTEHTLSESIVKETRDFVPEKAIEIVQNNEEGRGALPRQAEGRGGGDGRHDQQHHHHQQQQHDQPSGRGDRRGLGSPSKRSGRRALDTPGMTGTSSSTSSSTPSTRPTPARSSSPSRTPAPPFTTGHGQRSQGDVPPAVSEVMNRLRQQLEAGPARPSVEPVTFSTATASSVTRAASSVTTASSITTASSVTTSSQQTPLPRRLQADLRHSAGGDHEQGGGVYTSAVRPAQEEQDRLRREIAELKAKEDECARRVRAEVGSGFGSGSQASPSSTGRSVGSPQQQQQQQHQQLQQHQSRHNPHSYTPMSLSGGDEAVIAHLGREKERLARELGIQLSAQPSAVLAAAASATEDQDAILMERARRERERLVADLKVLDDRSRLLSATPARSSQPSSAPVIGSPMTASLRPMQRASAASGAAVVVPPQPAGLGDDFERAWEEACKSALPPAPISTFSSHSAGSPERSRVEPDEAYVEHLRATLSGPPPQDLFLTPRATPRNHAPRPGSAQGWSSISAAPSAVSVATPTIFTPRRTASDILAEFRSQRGGGGGGGGGGGEQRLQVPSRAASALSSVSALSLVSGSSAAAQPQQQPQARASSLMALSSSAAPSFAPGTGRVGMFAAPAITTTTATTTATSALASAPLAVGSLALGGIRDSYVESLRQRLAASGLAHDPQPPQPQHQHQQPQQAGGKDAWFPRAAALAAAASSTTPSTTLGNLMMTPSRLPNGSGSIAADVIGSHMKLRQREAAYTVQPAQLEKEFRDSLLDVPSFDVAPAVDNNQSAAWESSTLGTGRANQKRPGVGVAAPLAQPPHRAAPAAPAPAHIVPIRPESPESHHDDNELLASGLGDSLMASSLHQTGSERDPSPEAEPEIKPAAPATVIPTAAPTKKLSPPPFTPVSRPVFNAFETPIQASNDSAQRSSIDTHTQQQQQQQQQPRRYVVDKATSLSAAPSSTAVATSRTIRSPVSSGSGGGDASKWSSPQIRQAMTRELRTRKGEMLIKYEASGRPRARFINIEGAGHGRANPRIIWRETRLGPESGSADIDRGVQLVHGLKSVNFKAALAASATDGSPPPEASLAFSLVTPAGSIDLVAASADQYEVWVSAIKELLMA